MTKLWWNLQDRFRLYCHHWWHQIGYLDWAKYKNLWRHNQSKRYFHLQTIPWISWTVTHSCERAFSWPWFLFADDLEIENFPEEFPRKFIFSVIRFLKHNFAVLHCLDISYDARWDKSANCFTELRTQSKGGKDGWELLKHRVWNLRKPLFVFLFLPLFVYLGLYLSFYSWSVFVFVRGHLKREKPLQHLWAILGLNRGRYILYIKYYYI